MANELVPQPDRQPPDDSGVDEANKSSGHHKSDEHKVLDPLVAAGYVETDEQTAGEEWDLPPEDVPWEGFQAARRARRAAENADYDARWARRHGLPGFAALRASDAEDNRQQGWGDWGDLRTWLIIAAMFFGFLLFTAFVYFSPTGRHNQNDGPMSVPPIRVYVDVKDVAGL